MLITFEGCEGSGKSTQIKRIEEVLRAQAGDVLMTREPGGTAISDQIRGILLNAENKDMVHDCELLLYYAARAQHVEQVIKPALTQGRTVLCDRFVDATHAYQHYGRGVDLQKIIQLDRMVLQNLVISKTVLFDLPVELGLSRARSRMSGLPQNKREERFENEELAFHQRVRDGYLTLAQKYPQRFVVIDASKDPDDVFKQIKMVLGL